MNIRSRGSISIFVMLFGTVASLIVGSIVLIASMQVDNAVRSNSFEQALSIAEAGIHYYRWHLAHSPNDYQDGTGHAGPYIHQFKDPQGAVIGSYSLTITPPVAGSTVVTIKSTGTVTGRSNVKRVIAVKLGIPSLAKYAFLYNSTAWLGSGLTVHGQVLSNGGIRQDGTNDSLIQSSLATYTCGTETGCSPSRTKPAIWGSGDSQALWQFPVPAVDFNAVSISYTSMKTDAQSMGVYYGSSGSLGYHVVFNADGTVNVYKVTRTQNVKGIDINGNCSTLAQKIQNETLLGNYSQTTKHILFFEDIVWVEGTITNRSTVVAARFPLGSNNEDIWIKNNLTYTVKDGSVALGLIAQRNIFFVQDIPTNFEVDGALMAQNGSVFRHDFAVSGCNVNGNAVRNSLTMYGSLMSGLTSGWNWGTPPESGFTTRTSTHDNHMNINPPPYFPVNQSEGYQFTSWSEESP